MAQFAVDIAQKEMRSPYVDFNDDREDGTVTESLSAQLNENLAKLAVPQLSSREQISLADIIECVATAEKHRRSMDDNAMRYLLFFRQHMLRRGQAPEARVKITWREIVWAFHSGSQDILVDLISRQFQGKMLWVHGRESGMFMWMTDITALVSIWTSPRKSLTDSRRREHISRSLLAMSIPRHMRKTLLTAAFTT